MGQGEALAPALIACYVRIMFLTLTFLIALTGMAVAPSTAAAPAQAAITDMQEGKGSFDVTAKPNAGIAGPVGVLTLTKTYHGDLEASATGQMLGFGDPAGGAAAYMAIEQVTGTLAGHKGSFALRHSGSMADGKQEMSVTIAPGSGTGDLKGISGRLDIIVEAGVLHYTLPR